MHACYPDQVGGDNPVSQVEMIGPVPDWDKYSLATTVAGVMRTQGHPGQDSTEGVVAGGTIRGSQFRKV